VYSACKVASMLLKISGRRRVSGAEAFERVMVIVPVSSVQFDLRTFFLLTFGHLRALS